MMIPERTIAGVTWRLLLGRRRWLAGALVSLLPVLVAWLYSMENTGEGAERHALFFSLLMNTLVFTVLLPLAALVNGTSAFGTELDDGTLRYVLAKPVARWRIVIAKLFAATAVTATVVLPGLWIAGALILGTPLHRLIAGFTVGALLASLLYPALFMLLSLVTRRALIIGLLYVIAWEGVLTRIFEGAHVLSIREYAMSAAEAVGGRFGAAAQTAGVPVPDGFAAQLELSTALPLALLILMLAVGVTVARLRVLEVSEEV